MATIPPTFGVPEATLANFDWFDIATGTGYKTFYAMDVNYTSAPTSEYIISSQVYYSSRGRTGFTNTAGQIDFDLSFEVPITVEGEIVVNMPVATPHNIGAMDFTIYVFHVDKDNNQIQIGSTIITANSATLNDSYDILSVRFTVDVIRFKAGEKFRLIVSNPTAGAGKTLYWLHDPKGRNFSLATSNFVTSALSISLPIKI